MRCPINIKQTKNSIALVQMKPKYSLRLEHRRGKSTELTIGTKKLLQTSSGNLKKSVVTVKCKDKSSCAVL